MRWRSGSAWCTSLVAAMLGCGRAEPPPAGRDELTSPPAAAEAEPSPPEPAVIPTPTPPEDEAEQQAWARIDAMFRHVVVASRRFALLEGLDDSAIDEPRPEVKRLSYQHGVRGFEPDPSCDPRAKCQEVAVWAAPGGVYLHLRAHRDEHAAGAFDAMHRIGPLTVEVQIDSSDAVLRRTLLRELRVFAGERAVTEPGCVDPVQQAAAWLTERGRARGLADEVRVEPLDFTPYRESVDLDGDGTPELVLALHDYGRNTEHFFFAKRGGCPTLVAVISLWSLGGIGCHMVPGRELCDLYTNELMVHGDQQTSTWRFDGTRYVEAKDR